MMNPIDYSISKFASFVDEDTFLLINQNSDVIDVKKGTVIENRGDDSNYIYLIQDGLVQLSLNSSNGSKFNLTRLGAGHTFGETAFFLNNPVIHDAEAKTDVIIQKLSRQTIDKLMSESLVFSKALVSVACMRVQTTLSHIGDTLGMPLEARVAKQIISVSESVGGRSTINVRQRDLAHALGVSRVSIGKAVKELANLGLIKTGYGKLHIVLRDDLNAMIKANTRQF